MKRRTDATPLLSAQTQKLLTFVHVPLDMLVTERTASVSLAILG